MKYSRLCAAVLALPLAASLGCKKDTDEPFKPCERGNYGTITVNFGATTTRHSILIAYSAAKSRRKSIAIGVSSDTILLRSGTYPVTISSVDSTDKPLISEDKSLTSARCSEETVSVAF